MADFDNRESRDLVFSKAVRAGKRTYFFDVKSTRANEYYLTITESKKKFGDDGEKPYYEKHKLFLYKEDFEKFVDGLNETVEYIRNSRNETHNGNSESAGNEGNRFSDLNFDDLGDK